MNKIEFMEKYKDVEFTFASYYKYTFTFEGVTEDGKTVVLSCGGDSSDIYRYEVVAGLKESIHGLDPYSGEAYEGVKVVDSFYE